MIQNINKSIFLAVIGLSLISCAKEEVDSDKTKQERVLDAYIAEYCPSAKKQESGLTIIDYAQGSGEQVEKYNVIYANYTSKTLGGVYKETTNEELSKVLGTFSNSTYYGPKLFEIGYGTTYVGLEELFIGMKKGGKATAIVPPWLTTKYNNKNWIESNSFICEIEITDVIKDMKKYQTDTMKSYAQIHYPGLDTTSSGFYYKDLKDVSTDTLKNGTVSVYYVGRLLNGFVFDTNIADTAKKYKIYNSNNSYSPLSVTIDENLKTMANSNNLVEGFCKALQKMSYGDEAFTMFSSDYGYGANGSGQIGPYQPLIFWLYIEPND